MKSILIAQKCLKALNDEWWPFLRYKVANNFFIWAKVIRQSLSLVQDIFFVFSSRSLKTREKCISFSQFVYFYNGSVFTFQFLNEIVSNYVKIFRLSKPDTFFSRFEGTRGEKTQIFCTFVHREKCFFDFNPSLHANVWSNKTTDFGNSTDWPFYWQPFFLTYEKIIRNLSLFWICTAY